MTAITEEEIARRQEEIMELAANLNRKLVVYLFDVASTGRPTPVPPRPKMEVIRTVNLAARLLDSLTASEGVTGMRS